MHQYTHPSAEPKGKAAARNLANVKLTASSKGKKTSQTAKGSFGGPVQEMHNFEWASTAATPAFQIKSVQQVIDNQTSREEDSA